MSDKKKYVWYLSVFLLLLLIGGGSIKIFQDFQSIPAFSEIKNHYSTSDILLLDRQGKILHEIRGNKKFRSLSWTPLEQISPLLLKAVVQIEDQRFFHHRGVDYWAMGRAFWELVSHRQTVSGASTLSMQLSFLLEQEKKKTVFARKNVWQKLVQIYRGVLLDAKWSKNEILEAYLNHIYYRGELRGIKSASYGLFQVAPLFLNTYQSALLVSLIRSPQGNASSLERRTGHTANVLGWSHETEKIQSMIAQLTSQGPEGPMIKPSEFLAPVLARRILQERKTMGYEDQSVIQTTLDKDIQTAAQEILARNVLLHKDQNMNDGAILVLENTSGDVLAYVGNIGKHSSSHYIDGVMALRQAGSTLKPFIYGLAFDRRLLTPATVLNDDRLSINVGGNLLYSPQNYDKSFRQHITVRMALASSLNIPAVNVLELLGGAEIFVSTLQQLGFSKLQSPEFYGPSLALGAVDVSLWDLTNAYRTWGNRGVYSPISYYKKSSADTPTKMFKQQPVYSPESSFLITNILSDSNARILTFGIDNLLNTPYWTAAKTGTSKDMRDNWTIGLGQHYTVGVWAGNFQGDPMWNVSGIQGAAPAWRGMMDFLHKKLSSHAPTVPRNIVSTLITYKEPTTRTLKEWFIKGTTPVNRTIKTAKEQVNPQIHYPIDGSVLAIDPDIPQEKSKIFFQVKGDTQNLDLYLNHQILSSLSGQRSIPFQLKSGKFLLELKNSQGDILDASTFYVR